MRGIEQVPWIYDALCHLCERGGFGRWRQWLAGGARASGTNDKAGSPLNLMRWVSPRAIKETFVPATHFSYPFMRAGD